MNTEILGILLLLLALVGCSIPLGRYIARVYMGERTWTDFFSPIERLFFRIAGINPNEEWTWQRNLKALLSLNLLFFVWAIVILLVQADLPLNPDGIPNMELTQAFNTAVSFVTNTNLQHYSGETGASYFSQLLVFCFLQFVSAATGMAALAMLFKAVTNKQSGLTGNFYNYFLKSCTRVLLPLSFILAFLLLSQGTPATLEGAGQSITMQGDTVSVARGPVAPMVAIKQMGTNGGGFFGPNSTHPFENPTYLSNLLENFAIIIIPMAMVWAFGYYTGRKRMARVLFLVMAAGAVLLLVPTIVGEMGGNTALNPIGIDQSLGSMEGKEVRIGSGASATWGVITTVTSNGSVNAMHDSFTALSGTWLLLGMMVNSFFGGVGVGFLNIYIFLILAVFIAALMVGRTPELMGKKVEAREVKVAALVFLLHPTLILVGTAIAAYLAANDPAHGMMGADNAVLAWLNNPGYHGFSEMLYEFTSASANNGSGFEGLGDNTPFWNLMTGMVMLFARFLPIIGPVAIAGYLAEKKYVPESAGTLPLDTPTFGFFLFMVIVILSALAFFPALVLGPIAEHFTIVR
jgi:potassium-transporting ATPase potassium-binding subunit